MSNHSQNKTATAHHHTELEKRESERYLQCVLYLCHREHFTIAVSKSGIVYITSITNRLVWCYSYSWLFPQNTAERNNSTTHEFYFFLNPWLKGPASDMYLWKCIQTLVKLCKGIRWLLQCSSKTLAVCVTSLASHNAHNPIYNSVFMMDIKL